MEIPIAILPGKGGYQPFQTRGHFCLRVPSAVILGYDVVPVSTNHTTVLAVDEQGGDDLSAVSLPAGPARTISARG